MSQVCIKERPCGDMRGNSFPTIAIRFVNFKLNLVVNYRGQEVFRLSHPVEMNARLYSLTCYLVVTIISFNYFTSFHFICLFFPFTFLSLHFLSVIACILPPFFFFNFFFFLFCLLTFFILAVSYVTF